MGLEFRDDDEENDRKSKSWINILRFSPYVTISEKEYITKMKPYFIDSTEWVFHDVVRYSDTPVFEASGAEAKSELPTPTISKSEEFERIKEENRYLREQNLKLTDIIQTLKEDLTNLTYQYDQSYKMSTKAIEELKEEIKILQDQIKEIQEARTLKFILPESWLEEEEEDYD